MSSFLLWRIWRTDCTSLDWNVSVKGIVRKCSAYCKKLLWSSVFTILWDPSNPRFAKLSHAGCVRWFFSQLATHRARSHREFRRGMPCARLGRFAKGRPRKHMADEVFSAGCWSNTSDTGVLFSSANLVAMGPQPNSKRSKTSRTSFLFLVSNSGLQPTSDGLQPAIHSWTFFFDLKACERAGMMVKQEKNPIELLAPDG